MLARWMSVGAARSWPGAWRAVRACALLLACAWACLWASTVRAEVPLLSLEDAAARLAGGGWLLMMRHAATEPGLGDPAGFRVDDCATQRNLSDEGRRQARETGVAMRAAGIVIDEVRASPWCRCRDTAQLAFGRHEAWAPLGSFFDRRADEAAATREVRALARTQDPRRNLMLVTHQVNVTAVYDVFPAVGEIVAGRWRGGRLAAEFRFAAAAR